MRLTTQVKTALCNCLIWDIAGIQMAIRVPNTKEARPMSDWLLSHNKPSATYMHPRQKTPVAFQWFLNKSEYRALWLAGAKVRING